MFALFLFNKNISRSIRIIVSRNEQDVVISDSYLLCSVTVLLMLNCISTK